MDDDGSALRVGAKYKSFTDLECALKIFQQDNSSSSSSSSSGIEQESLPTVSSSVNLHVSGTHRCSPLVYLHLKRSLFLQLKLYTWGPCLATGGANP